MWRLMIDHRRFVHNLNSYEIKAWKKKSGLNGIQTHYAWDSGAVQLPTDLSSELGAGYFAVSL